ncbi:SET domain protein [Ichthyophthirius multifiliis]|uniref:SET domain protein n=1 Tax=Ichthyophthirius multifiliis TaxID=5932 RepID=G0QQS0_ICHMU|nr:SET domain protein [Ichthyophthirius multifiliis]EGR32441.1 SET domain protein [Ichthyophthirius multifiliis]|eukprot:XP_004036427.1 SET domain protein [Ichthyophthirius multifiliis]
MQKLTQGFLQKSIQNYPKTQNVLQWVCDNKKTIRFRLFSEIELKSINDPLKNINKGLGLVSQQEIQAGSEVFLVSTEKSITGLELVGSDRIKAYEINDSVTKIASKYYEKNPYQFYYIQNVLKIITQLNVHSKFETMQLYPYADYLLKYFLDNANEIPKNPLYWDTNTIKGIYSSYLASLISSTHSQFQSITEDLYNNRLFGFVFQDFCNYMSIVRSRNLNFLPEQPKHFDINSVVIMTPVVDWINHSFQPNCRVTGTYFEHENESYVCVKAIKDILPGEELTLNYGNMPNYDFLMKYGFVNQINEFNEFGLNLNFDNYLEYTSQQFELKQKIFKIQKDFTLDRFVIYQNKINKDLLRTLRIYFISDQDVFNNTEISTYMFNDFDKQISTQNEVQLCKYMINILNQEKQKYIKNRQSTLDYNKIERQDKKGLIIDIDTLNEIHLIQDQNYRNMLHICIEEQIVIDNNIKFFTKMLEKVQ